MVPLLTHGCLAAWLVLAAGPSRSGPDGASPQVEVRDVTRETLIAALRASRAPEGPEHADVVATIQSLGSTAIPAMLELLVQRRVPALAPGEKPQTLSQPQRDMLLAGFALWSPRATIDAIEARIAAAPGPNERIAGIYVYAALGQGAHLERVIELALAPEQHELPPERLPKDFEKAVRESFARILTRDPQGYRNLRTTIERAPACLHRPMVFALGDTRDSCGIEPLALVLAFHAELAPLVIGQARLLGRSADDTANHTLAKEVRPYLESERVELACAAARSLGELGDDESVAKLLEMLDSPLKPVVDSAHWALRRLSGLNLPPLPGPWRASLASDQLWWDTEATQVLQALVVGTPPERLAAVGSLDGRPWRRAELAREVVATLEDESEVVRLKACAVLAQLGSPAATEGLIGALSDESEAVAQAALKALTSIHGRVLSAEPSEVRSALHL